jgi:hypothetical protein
LMRACPRVGRTQVSSSPTTEGQEGVWVCADPSTGEEPQARPTIAGGLREPAPRCLEVQPSRGGRGAPFDQGQGGPDEGTWGQLIVQGRVSAQPRVKVTLRTPNAEGAWQAIARLDTGAELCLLRRGLPPADAFREDSRPLGLVTATNCRGQWGIDYMGEVGGRGRGIGDRGSGDQVDMCHLGSKRNHEVSNRKTVQRFPV